MFEYNIRIKSVLKSYLSCVFHTGIVLGRDNKLPSEWQQPLRCPGVEVWGSLTYEVIYEKCVGCCRISVYYSNLGFEIQFTRLKRNCDWSKGVSQICRR